MVTTHKSKVVRARVRKEVEGLGRSEVQGLSLNPETTEFDSADTLFLICMTYMYADTRGTNIYS